LTTVLLVDDSRVTREVIKIFLVGRGVRILEAGDGREALTLMHEYHPDLVITDFEMPRLDGLGLCKAAHADLRLWKIPVVVLSGAVTPEQIWRCKSAGARDVLPKPVQRHALLAAIDRLLPARAPDLATP
jgi:CheY-like chemotaxis protein